MKKSRFLWLILLILAIGCAKVEKKDAVDWHIGVKGLEMNFMEGTPRVVYHDGGPYSGILELWNKGTTKIESGRVYYSGFDRGIITGIEDLDTIPTDLDGDPTPTIIEGVTQYNPEGGYATLSNNNINVEYDFPTGVLNTKIRATAIYPYATEFSTDFCVDSKPYTTKDKVCTMADKTFSGGQGAPVAVTKVEPQVVGDGIRFKITFRNAGNGDVLDSSKAGTDASTKPSDLKVSDYDYVSVTEPKLGGTDGSCQPTPRVKLVNGQGFTFCTFTVTGDEAYTTRLNLKLGYGYMSSTETNVQVKAIPGSTTPATPPAGGG